MAAATAAVVPESACHVVALASEIAGLENQLSSLALIHKAMASDHEREERLLRQEALRDEDEIAALRRALASFENPGNGQPAPPPPPPPPLDAQMPPYGVAGPTRSSDALPHDSGASSSQQHEQQQQQQQRRLPLIEAREVHAREARLLRDKALEKDLALQELAARANAELQAAVSAAHTNGLQQAREEVRAGRPPRRRPR